MSWEQISCAEREALYAGSVLSVGASLTDLDGQYGDPRVLTEWHDRATDVPVLRDQRWPQLSGEKPDARPCRHERWSVVDSGSRPASLTSPEVKS